MYCVRCGAALKPGQSFCGGCGTQIGGVPLMPVQSRLAGHMRLLAIFWFCPPGLSPHCGDFPVDDVRAGRRIPAGRCSRFREWDSADSRLCPRRRRGDRISRRLGVAGSSTLGADAGDRAGLLQPFRYSVRIRGWHLHALGAAARTVRRGIPPDLASRVKQMAGQARPGYGCRSGEKVLGRSPRLQTGKGAIELG